MENNAKILFFSKSKPFKESFFHLKNYYCPLNMNPRSELAL